MKQPCFAKAKDALKAMLGGGMKYNVWNKLVRRSLYVENNISFPAGNNMGEDMTILLLFTHARNVTYMPKALYHYVKINTSAISRGISDSHWTSLKYNVNRVEDYVRNVYGSELDIDIAFFKLEAKFPFLIMGNTDLYHLWKDWFTESNKYILLNKNISKRNRFIQWCAWHNQFWLVYLYNKFVLNFIYGIIYK